MSSWAARMHRRAATFSNVVTSCGHPSGPYPRRLEKVKFGVPLEEVCKNDIPGPLLVSTFRAHVLDTRNVVFCNGHYISFSICFASGVFIQRNTHTSHIAYHTYISSKNIRINRIYTYFMANFARQNWYM